MTDFGPNFAGGVPRLRTFQRVSVFGMSGRPLPTPKSHSREVFFYNLYAALKQPQRNILDSVLRGPVEQRVLVLDRSWRQ